MIEKDKIIEVVAKINEGLMQTKGAGIEGSIVNDIKELEVLMNKFIRAGVSNLSKEEVLDIIEEFKIKIRKNRGGLFSDDEILGTEEIDYLAPSNEMLEEFLSSLDNNLILSEPSKVLDGKLYVNQERINELKSIKSTFDLSKLIRLCEELNIAYKNQSYYTVGFLVRIIKDHIPPIFGKKSFAEVAAGVGSESVKKSLQHLESSLKNIADDMAHGHISRKEILPNNQRISFQADLDVLLGLIIKELS